MFRSSLHRTALSLLLFAASTFLSPRLEAKRPPPPDVSPVTYLGVRYENVPNQRENGMHVGYVEAWDIQANKKLWGTTVYRDTGSLKAKDSETYIKSMSVEGEKLKIENEKDAVFFVDLKTHRVTKGP